MNKYVEADQRAQYWLAEMNSLEESGQQNTKAFEKAERKAQYWLDRLNRILGNGDGSS
jgi:hypothetical protein